MRICPLCRKPLFKDQPKRMVMVGRPARGVTVHLHCLEDWREEREEKRKEVRRGSHGVGRLTVIRRSTRVPIETGGDEVGRGIEVIKGGGEKWKT